MKNSLTRVDILKKKDKRLIIFKKLISRDWWLEESYVRG